jgi:biotin carboxyl carrier protein
MRITVEGKSYDVTAEILDDDPAFAHHPAQTALHNHTAAAPHTVYHPAEPHDSAGEGGNLLCPISGTVITIHVQQGQHVKKGETIVTLEAMKMNTPVFAPRDCAVSEIKVQTGAQIKEGAVIAVIS